MTTNVQKNEKERPCPKCKSKDYTREIIGKEVLHHCCGFNYDVKEGFDAARKKYIAIFGQHPAQPLINCLKEKSS